MLDVESALDNRASLPVSWRGKRLSFLPYLDSLAGYYNHALQLFRHWEALGVFVTVRPVFIKDCDESRISMDLKRAFVHRDQPQDWEFVLSPANFCPMGRRKTAFMTMYESSRFTPKQVKLLNRAEAIIVPCEFNRQGLRESGCIRPIHVVPLGFAEESFKTTPMDMDGPCVFGAAGRMSHGVIRKGLNAVIDAFLAEFPTEPDVRLHVKGFSDSQTKYVIDRRVVVREGFLKESQLAEWYSNLTAFVSAARCEAWGLMQLESMASGRPVIAPIYAGLSEFLTPENAYAVDFVEEPSLEAWRNGGSWALPDEKHLRWQMRQVYKNRHEARRKGQLAAETTKHLTWRNSAFRTLEVLEELGAI